MKQFWYIVVFVILLEIMLSLDCVQIYAMSYMVANDMPYVTYKEFYEWKEARND